MRNPAHLTVAQYLAKAIEFSGKTQREIAAEVGYPKPNVVSMMKQRQTKAPLDKIPALARARHLDSVHFLRLAFAEYHPEVWDALTDNIGFPLTANEWDMVTTYQVVAPRNEIEMTPERTFKVMVALRDGLRS